MYYFILSFILQIVKHFCISDADFCLFITKQPHFSACKRKKTAYGHPCPAMENAEPAQPHSSEKALLPICDSKPCKNDFG